MGKAAAGTLEYAALLQDFGNAIALQRFTRLFLPVVGHEWLAVHLGNRLGNALLQTQ